MSFNGFKYTSYINQLYFIILKHLQNVKNPLLKITENQKFARKLIYTTNQLNRFVARNLAFIFLFN